MLSVITIDLPVKLAMGGTAVNIADTIFHIVVVAADGSVAELCPVIPRSWLLRSGLRPDDRGRRQEDEGEQRSADGAGILQLHRETPCGVLVEGVCGET